MLFERLAAMTTLPLVLSGSRIRSVIAGLKSRHLQPTMGDIARVSQSDYDGPPAVRHRIRRKNRPSQAMRGRKETWQ